MIKLGEVHCLETADGHTLWFPSDQMKILAFGNYGAPPVSFTTQKIYRQDGVSEIDYTTNPRSIILRIFHDYTGNRLGYWNARAKLHEFFRPNRNGKLKLTLRLPTGDLRTLDVRAEPGLEFGPKEDNSWIIDESVGLIAHDPMWYDPIPDTLQLNGFYGAHLIFPATFPIQFGPSGLQYITQVNYNGTWQTPVEIDVYGPYDWISITNVATGKQLTLDVPISPTESRHINLKPGETDVTDETGNSVYGEFGPLSNLSDFFIHPVPEVPAGSNNAQHYKATKAYNPLRYYRFGEPAGTGAAVDFGEDLEAGVYTGDIHLDMPGALSDDPDTCVYFGGSDSQISIPDFDLVNKSYTLEFFFKPKSGDTLSSGNKRTIFYLTTTGTDWLSVWYNHGFRRLFVEKTALYTVATPSYSITEDVWNHVMVVYNHLNAVCYVYINGVLEGSDSIYDITFPTQSAVISMNQSGLHYPLYGSLDEFAIYLRAFTDAEVSEKYRKHSICDSLYTVGGKQIIQANVAGARGSGYFRAVIDDHPVRYYRFNEAASATQVLDYGSDGATGQVANCTFQQTGAIPKDTDSAVSFNGVDSVITIPDPVLFGRSFSIEWWMNPAYPSLGYNVPWSFFAGGNPGENLFALYNNAGELYIFNTYGYEVSTALNAVPIGKYTHCVYTFDKLTGTGQLYINGVLVDTQSMPEINTLFDNESCIGAFHIGAGGFNFYEGVIDEFSMYYYALTANMVKLHYDRRLRRFAADVRVKYNKRYYGV